MKRNIAIIAGGYSSEHDVSLRSAKGIMSFIDKDRYNAFLLDIEKHEWNVVCGQDRYPVDKNDLSFTDGNGEKTQFDFAYITIHGDPGENGKLEGYLDMLGIAYSCCGVFAGSLTFNKFACNNYLKSFGIRTAESICLRRGQHISDKDVITNIELPCFVKPNLGGSSFGVTKVKTPAEIQPAIEKAFHESDEVMIEAFMKGTEVTCGCYKTKDKSVVLPITEVVTENEFFDYNAKYNGQVQEITPARISQDLTDRIQKITSLIYDIIGCSGIIRADYIISDDGKINLLEVNTTPGMTETSFIPQQVKAAGLAMSEVITDIIEDKIS